jgi:hypothetical protein
MNLTPIESGNCIQLPADWMRALGLHGLVALERISDGILVRPFPRATWEEISATKLVIGSVPPDKSGNEGVVTGDDFLFWPADPPQASLKPQ